MFVYTVAVTRKFIYMYMIAQQNKILYKIQKQTRTHARTHCCKKKNIVTAVKRLKFRIVHDKTNTNRTRILKHGQKNKDGRPIERTNDRTREMIIY